MVFRHYRNPMEEPVLGYGVKSCEMKTIDRKTGGYGSYGY